MPSWPSGIGQSLGDQLVTASPLMTSYTVYFVDSQTGSDAYSGLDPDSPLLTTGAALTAAAFSGLTPIVVYLSGHTETIASSITPTAGTIFVGAGASGGLPTVKLKQNQSNATLFICSAAGIQFRNIWFQSNNVSSNLARVKFTGINGLVDGCYFECAATDLAAGLELGTGGSGTSVRNTTFISTATAVASKPTLGMLVSAALTDIEILSCNFSEGTVGYSTRALDFSATVTRLRAEPIGLLLGANATFGAATGVVMPTVVTGAGTISYSGGA